MTQQPTPIKQQQTVTISADLMAAYVKLQRASEKLFFFPCQPWTHPDATPVYYALNHLRELSESRK